MPTTTVYNWENIKASRYRYNCKPWSTNYNNTLMGRTTSTKLDPEHRPKPDDLIFNQTNRSEQLTYEWTRAYAGGQTNWGRWEVGCGTGYCAYDSWVSGTKTDPIVSLSALPYPDNWALNLRTKIKAEALNLGTSLAEYRQSAMMFGSAATAIVNAWKAYKGTRRLRITPCDVPASLLVYTYGVAPLLSDLYTSVEILKLRMGHAVRRRYYVQEKVSQRNTLTTTPQTGLTSTVNARTVKKREITAHVEFSVKSLADSFTVGNPLEIAWELIPYSFVIDWVVPIGDWLSSLDALRAVDTMRVSQVDRTKYDHYERLVYVKNGYTHTSESGDGRPGIYKYRSHQRTIMGSVPLPSLPPYKPSRSLKAVANGLALLWQSFGQRLGKCKPMRSPRR